MTATAFTAKTRERILEALRVGASHQTAAYVAGIDPDTLRRWLVKGRNATEPDSQFAAFAADVLAAEAHPRERALGIIYRAMPDRPDLAFKYIERKEPGYAPPMAEKSQAPSVTVIQLAFADGRELAPEVVQIEQEVPAVAGRGLAALPAPAEPAPDPPPGPA